MSRTLISLLFLNALPAALAVGSARVVNNCGSSVPVYFASISANGGNSALSPLPAAGYSEVFNKPNIGISIKLAASASGPVTQFEFTWYDGTISYDISNIDGNPFAKQGMSLIPSDGVSESFPSCVEVDCPAGQSSCNAAYNLPDDVRTKVCSEDTDLTFTLCPGGGSGSSDSAGEAKTGSSGSSKQQVDTPEADTSPDSNTKVAAGSSPVVKQNQQTKAPASTHLRPSWNIHQQRHAHGHQFD